MYVSCIYIGVWRYFHYLYLHRIVLIGFISSLFLFLLNEGNIFIIDFFLEIVQLSAVALTIYSLTLRKSYVTIYDTCSRCLLLFVLAAMGKSKKTTKKRRYEHTYMCILYMYPNP